MIGKKDTVAIFESYHTYLKEQDETVKDANIVMDSLLRLIQQDKTKLIYGKELVKLTQFLTNPKTIELYNAYEIQPMRMQSSSVEGDSSAVNMGEDGVLEVQPDGNYPQ